MQATWLVLLCGCGGSAPTSPADVSLSVLKSAPLTVVADGQRLTSSAALWRDFMPISPPDGKALAAGIRIATEDGSPVSPRVVVDTTWVVHGSEVWQATPEQRPRIETSPAYEVVARDGPKWGPGVSVDVVVRLTDSGGRKTLLRAADQMIRGTF